MKDNFKIGLLIVCLLPIGVLYSILIILYTLSLPMRGFLNLLDIALGCVDYLESKSIKFLTKLFNLE